MGGLTEKSNIVIKNQEEEPRQINIERKTQIGCTPNRLSLTSLAWESYLALRLCCSYKTTKSKFSWVLLQQTPRFPF